MKAIGNIAGSLVETLKKTDLRALTAEYGEIVLDSFLADGIVKNIPVLNTISAFFKTSVTVSDRNFTKKIIHFLTQINDVPAEKREELINKIDESNDYRIKVGEKLLYIVDKCDDHEKAEIVGVLFKAFLLKKLDYDSFLRCCLVIEKSLASDLREFVLEDDQVYSIEYNSDLLAWGLLRFKEYNLSLEKSANYDDYTRKQYDEYKLNTTELELELSFTGNVLREQLRQYYIDLEE